MSSGQQGIFREQHQGKETTMHVDVSSVVDIRGRLNLASATVNMPPTLAKGYIPLPLMQARAKATATASGLAALTTAQTPGLHNFDVTSGPVRIRWATGNQNPVYWGPISVPDDLATAGGLGVRLTIDRVSGSATGTSQEFFVQFWNNRSTASGGFTTVAYTTAGAEVTATIASGQVPATGFFTIALKPGAHASVEVDLYNAGLTYTKRSSG